jgi:hypothetical protein
MYSIMPVKAEAESLIKEGNQVAYIIDAHQLVLRRVRPGCGTERLASMQNPFELEMPCDQMR